MRGLWWFDGQIFRLLRSVIGFLDGLVPFGKKELVRVLLFIYVAARIGQMVQNRDSIFEIISPLAIIYLFTLSGHRSGESFTVLLFFRLFIVVMETGTAALDLFSHDHLGLVANVDYVFLVYAADMDEQGPKERRRVVNALTIQQERPGYSTA